MMNKPTVLYLVPYICRGCNANLGTSGITWDASMPVGEVNEKCPQCGDNHIVVFGLPEEKP